jgi:UDP-GlcNAc:undecaprenyl-phosphate/decaprenyl-phosphate GlcNAc-1-phosphate transferase
MLTISLFLLPLLGFLLVRVATGLFGRFSKEYNILNIKGIPHVGGIGMGIAFFVISLALIFLCELSVKLATGILLPSALILVFGIIDDKNELSVWQKLSVQVIAVTLLVFFGVRTKIANIGFIFNLAITFVWVIGITNAFNHLDIMDGLAAAAALIVSVAIFIITILNKDMAMALLSVSMAGIILGFLIRNFPRAEIYMGNCGSHFLGFVLAVIMIAVSYAPAEHKVALFSPLLIMGLPIFDTSFVTLMRIAKGKSALMKSNDHLAMRFLKAGYSKKRTLFYFLSLSIFFASCGILLVHVSNLTGLILIGIVTVMCTALTIIMSRVRIDG